MKKYHFITLLLSILVLTSCGIRIEVQDVRGSHLESLNTEVKKDSVLIIDTRTNDKYKKGHINNAINIPLDEIKSRLDEVEDWKEKPIYLYAENDDESFKAAEILVANGCTNIYNAEGVEQYNYKFVSFTSVRGIVFERMLKESNTLIIDCRNKTSFMTGHIEGALLIPFSQSKAVLNKLPENKTLLLYCNVGTASARIAQELSSLGYKDVYNTVDGITEYPFKVISGNIIQE